MPVPVCARFTLGAAVKRLAILSMLAVSTSHAAPPQWDDQPDAPTRLIAFVGHFESIQEVDACTGTVKSEDTASLSGTESECIPFDGVFIATYRVGETLLGAPDGPTIAFRVADHYGFPAFARYKHALLFVQQSEGGNYLEKYQGFQLSATADGSWAHCAALDGQPVPELEKLLEPVAFASGVTFGSEGELNGKSLRDRYNAKYFAVRDGLVYCEMAIPLHALYEHVVNGVLRARGVTPPVER